VSKTVTMLGAGAFGTAVATILANNNFQVNLWCYEQEVVDDILNKQENSRYLPGIKLNSNIKPTTNIKKALTDSQWIFEAIPIKFLRNILDQTKEHITSKQIFIILSKGIEQETLLLPSEIIKNSLGKDTKVGIMSGPNFAKELALKCPSATTIACEDKDISIELCKILKNSYFKPYISNDLTGVQIGGAIKNVLVLIVGIARGYQSSQNTIAFLLTRGFSEMAQLCKFMGGEFKTIYGLCGLGDLFLCSSSIQSRNMSVGTLLGQGKNLEEIKTKLGVLPEGINTVQSVYQMIKKHNLDLPICKAIHQIIFENKPFDNFLDDLMKQDSCQE